MPSWPHWSFEDDAALEAFKETPVARLTAAFARIKINVRRLGQALNQPEQERPCSQ